MTNRNVIMIKNMTIGRYGLYLEQCQKTKWKWFAEKLSKQKQIIYSFPNYIVPMILVLEHYLCSSLQFPKLDNLCKQTVTIESAISIIKIISKISYSKESSVELILCLHSQVVWISLLWQTQTNIEIFYFWCCYSHSLIFLLDLVK